MEKIDNILNSAVDVFGALKDTDIEVDFEISQTELDESVTSFFGNILFKAVIQCPELKFDWIAIVNNDDIRLVAKIKLNDFTSKTHLSFFDLYNSIGYFKFYYSHSTKKCFFSVTNLITMSFLSPLPPLINNKYTFDPVSEVISRVLYNFNIVIGPSRTQSDTGSSSARSDIINIFDTYLYDGYVSKNTTIDVDLPQAKIAEQSNADIGSARALSDINGVETRVDIFQDIMTISRTRKIQWKDLEMIGWILGNDELSRQNMFGMYNKIYIIFRFIGNEDELFEVKSNIVDETTRKAKKVVELFRGNESFLKTNDLVIGSFTYEYTLRYLFYKVPDNAQGDILNMTKYINKVYDNGYHEISFGEKTKACRL